jgi:hypothetical protein
MTQVILTQSYRFHNCWSLRDAESDECLNSNIDPLCSNGAFAADHLVHYALDRGWDIVGIYVQEDRVAYGDTNMDAAEGALYRASLPHVV